MEVGGQEKYDQYKSKKLETDISRNLKKKKKKASDSYGASEGSKLKHRSGGVGVKKQRMSVDGNWRGVKSDLKRKRQKHLEMGKKWQATGPMGWEVRRGTT